MIDANTVRRIVRTAEVRPDDVVVEVGPGLGSLTLALLEVADRVTAVEIDDVLAAALPATITARMPGRADRFALVHSDAMHVTELLGPAPTALVANLPYNVAVPVLLHMLDTFPSIERTLVMVQSEVADRLAAAPGNKVYGVPSVKANWYADVKRAGAIGRNVFWPAPNVDSGLVSLVRRAEPIKTTAGKDEVFAVIDAALAQRRKTLRAALAGWAGSAAAAEAALVAAGGLAAGPRGGPDGGGVRADRGAQGERRVSVTVRVPAKVNVQLAVGAARPDGFHDLANVLLAVGLYDEVTVTPAEELRITCAGPDADQVPLDRTNLAARAATALAGRRGIEPHVHIHIAKDIPVAGGMAGGSADGAGALLACDTRWGTGASRSELLALCAELGSDVPFSLVGGAALGVGRGGAADGPGDRRHLPLGVRDGQAGALHPGGVPRVRPAGAGAGDPGAGGVGGAAGGAGEGGRGRAGGRRLQRSPARRAVPVPGAGGHAGGGARGGCARRAGLRVRAYDGLFARDAEAAEKVAAALRASGTCRAVRLAAGPVAGATVL